MSLYPTPSSIEKMCAQSSLLSKDSSGSTAGVS
jgi:hypothetical protein